MAALNKLQLGVFGRRTSNGFDVNYQAVIDFAVLQGYTLPSKSQQIIQNQLVLDMKSSGVWEKLDVFYNFVTDGEKRFSFINWINPLVAYIEERSHGDFVLTSNSHIKKQTGIRTSLNTNFIPSTHAIKWQLNNASFGWKQKNYSGSLGTDEGMVRGAMDGLSQTNKAVWIYEGNWNCPVWINKSGSGASFGNSYRFFSSVANASFNIGLLSNVAHLFKNNIQITTVAHTPNGLGQYPIHLSESSGSEKYRELQNAYIGEYFDATDQSIFDTIFNNYISSL